jgi:hypothetical protein
LHEMELNGMANMVMLCLANNSDGATSYPSSRQCSEVESTHD